MGDTGKSGEPAGPSAEAVKRKRIVIGLFLAATFGMATVLSLPVSRLLPIKLPLRLPGPLGWAISPLEPRLHPSPGGPEPKRSVRPDTLFPHPHAVILAAPIPAGTIGPPPAPGPPVVPGPPALQGWASCDTAASCMKVFQEIRFEDAAGLHHRCRCHTRGDLHGIHRASVHRDDRGEVGRPGRASRPRGLHRPHSLHGHRPVRARRH
jgi:hypothetical protein